MFDSGALDGAIDGAIDGASDAELDGAEHEGGAGMDTGTGMECGSGAGQMDCCPSDPDKTAPGVCGCGVPDSDRDDDETLDCEDMCPDDGNKTEPGVCGCDLDEPDSGASVSCDDLTGALVHRYPFNGSGVTINDVKGTANGLLINASLTGTGACTLTVGTNEQYVDLPNGILSALTDATIEIWVAWDGVGNWTRNFDFGNTTTMPEGSQGSGSTMAFLTPRHTDAGGVMRLTYSVTGSSGQTVLNATTALPSDGVHHVAAVFDDTGNTMRLYLDGQPEGSVAFNGTLGGVNGITDINNWLGRSQYNVDPELGGTVHEARIYNAALTDEQIAFSFAQGQNPAFLE
jgi:hypothetical protein